MKTIAIFIICLISLKIQAQENDGKKWEAPYHLETPKGWNVERFPMPVSFAPNINYNGMEDIRFTPDWGKKDSSSYWSYAFLWYLDGKLSFDAKTLENNLTDYYTGLFSINTDKSKIDSSKLVPVKVRLYTKKQQDGDSKTFVGKVTMNNYMTKMPITLNIIVHLKHCEGQNKTFAFFELSPQPYHHAVWNGLNQLWFMFKCIK